MPTLESSPLADPTDHDDGMAAQRVQARCTARCCGMTRGAQSSGRSAKADIAIRWMPPSAPRRQLRALRPGAMASWQQRAGRGDEGPEGYALGDVTRIGVQTIKDIFKGTADGTREITGGIKRRWQEQQYRDTVPLHMPYHMPYVSHVLPYCTYHIDRACGAVPYVLACDTVM